MGWTRQRFPFIAALCVMNKRLKTYFLVLLGFAVGVAVMLIMTVDFFEDRVRLENSAQVSLMSIEFGSNVTTLEALESGNTEIIKRHHLFSICQSISSFKEHVRNNDYGQSRKAELEKTLDSALRLIDKYRSQYELSQC